MVCESERIIELYQRHAGAWASKRGKTLFERDWLDRLLALATTGASILDMGCGCGDPISRYLIERKCAVTGVDSSPSMIAMCLESFPSHDWRVGDMRTLRLGRTFEGLLAWDSFFHLRPEDQRRMFAVFREHAAPGAPLMFTSGPEYGEALGAFEGEPLYHASLDGAEYRTLLSANSFEVMAHTVEDQNCGGHTIWLAQRR